MQILLFTTASSSYCERAKHRLKQRGLTYREIELGTRPGRGALVRRSGRMSFPQFFVDCDPIGGYAELAACVSSGASR
jgi:glutaredoxin 3